ncbi:Ig-like domain-containing protein [Arthrobacter sp. ZGTC131]|uniref:Ig-like domain-containing protein n=1 Tax=Arthrobacter sp. ZGTC131 TaxID=2058898 RepID=UPI000CE327B6|nr:Ig-like domain-containing protein [Arthrobacter sp. ZGTC131]
MKSARNHPRLAVVITAGALAALAIPTAVPAFAVINDPVADPHVVTVFPQRDMVSAEGYADGDRPTIQVLRGGAVIGTASNLVPVGGIVEVNHDGGGCWEGVTPDIRPGDVIRVLTAPDVGEQTFTGNVTVTQPATKVNAGTVVMKGTAVASGGGQLPADQLEARVVAPNQAFALNGRRTLRASAPGAGDDGVITYDGPGLTTWTATWTGLTGAGADGLSDADRAVSPTSESRGMWLGRNPDLLTEVTIFEYGAAGGPAAPDCTAPLAKGPTVPDLTAAADTGSSTTDNITRIAAPTFTGAVALPDATTVNLYVDGIASGSAPVAANGSYSITSSRALANGRHTVTAGEVGPAGIETMGTGSLSITVDTTAPVVTAKAPAVNSLMVGQTANVTATFSEPIAGLGTASFTLKNSAGAVIAAPVTWNATTRVATLNPNATLAADRKHTATLTAGIRDIAGNPIAANSWAFTTGPRPIVTAKSPAVNATAVSRTANVTATISESVTGVGNGTFALRNAATGALVSYAVSYNATTRVATLNPNVTLAANTRYTATISTSIKDAGGNPLSGLSWSFTTGR